MVKTTTDVIKVLPFDDAFKMRLLSVFDKLTPDQKYVIVDVLWNAYDAFFQIKLEENINLALADAAEGKTELDPEFYKRIEEQTEKEFESENVQATEHVDLSKARESLEQIIKQPPQTN